MIQKHGKTGTVQNVHPQNARRYILPEKQWGWRDILLIGRLLPSLHMCNTHFIRKRKCVCGTYAVGF